MKRSDLVVAVMMAGEIAIVAGGLHVLADKLSMAGGLAGLVNLLDCLLLGLSLLHWLWLICSEKAEWKGCRWPTCCNCGLL